MQPLPRKILHSEVGTVIRPAETAGRCIATTGCGPARGTGVVLRGTGVVLRGAGAAPVWDGCGPACGGAGMAVRRGAVLRCGWCGPAAGWCGPAVRLVWPCGAVGCGPLARRCGWCGPAARLVRRLRRGSVWRLRCGSVWRLRCGGAVLRPVSLARSGAWRREAPSRTRQGRARRPLRARRSGR